MADSMIGKTLPNVLLTSSTGSTVTIPQDLKGKWTLLYFYPKDDTPGCTQQACNYRDHITEFQRIGVQVFGVSRDSLDSHAVFIKKYNLNFPLLADTESKLCKALSVKTEKGFSRDTFLIDPKGKICEVWRKVSPSTTVMETLKAAQKSL